MKTVLAVMISLSLCVGASAQRRGGGFSHSYGGFSHTYVAPRVVVAPRVGFSYGYGYPAAGFGFGFGYPFFGYPYFGYPYPAYGYQGGYGYNNAAAQLSYKIQSIKLDYKAQIRETRHNKSLSRAERRSQINNLKNEREQAIIAAQEDFRKGRMNNYRNRDQNNNYQNQNNQNNQKDDSINPSSDTNS